MTLRSRVLLYFKLAVLLIRKNQKLAHLYGLFSLFIPLTLLLHDAPHYYQGVFIASNIYLVSLLSYDSDENTQRFYEVYSVSRPMRNLVKVLIMLLLIVAQNTYVVLATPRAMYLNNITLFFTIYLTFSHTAYALNGILSLGGTLASLFLSIITIFIIPNTFAVCFVWSAQSLLLLLYIFYKLTRYESKVY